jgi:hypothetical protein
MSQNLFELNDLPPDADQGVDPEEIGADLITDPFDPREIRIETKTLTVDLLVRRIKAGEIDLSPDFQREAGLWTKGAMSRLIESLLVRIPLPAFYMDATEDDHWLVVDGLQRLTVLKRFISEQSLALGELEFLTQFHDKTFGQLPRAMQRRLEETQVTVYLIQPGTPPQLKFNIFKRINTGGLPLSPQEIRHALNQGPAAELLKNLAAEPDFQRVAGRFIRNQRMTDRECALRFLAFVITPYRNYRTSDLDGFLNEHMALLNKMTEEGRVALSERFLRAMRIAWDLFEDDAFRKRYKPGDNRKPINKALFEVWSVAIDKEEDDSVTKLVQQRQRLLEGFVDLMNDREFDAAISQGTGDPRRVQLRFSKIEQLTKQVLE